MPVFTRIIVSKRLSIGAAYYRDGLIILAVDFWIVAFSLTAAQHAHVQQSSSHGRVDVEAAAAYLKY